MTAGDDTNKRICRKCPAVVIWVTMVDDQGVEKVKDDGKKVRNPLDPAFGEFQSEELLSTLQNVKDTHAVMYSASTGHGMMLSEATWERAQRWWAERQVTFHLSHFSTCPESHSFRTSAQQKLMP